MINRVIILGRMGKDPEERHLPTGGAVCDFTVATSEKRKDKGGQVKETTEWHNIVAFGKTAEAIAKYSGKGLLIAVEGRLRYESWEKEGVKHYKTKIIADKVQFVEYKKRDDQDQRTDYREQPQAPESDDSIPF